MTFDAAMNDAGRLLELPGVVGVGEGATPEGERSIVVMVASRSVAAVDEIPEQIRGIPVVIVETGQLSAEGADDPPPGDSIDPH